MIFQVAVPPIVRIGLPLIIQVDLPCDGSGVTTPIVQVAPIIPVGIFPLVQVDPTLSIRVGVASIVQVDLVWKFCLRIECRRRLQFVELVVLVFELFFIDKWIVVCQVVIYLWYLFPSLLCVLPPTTLVLIFVAHT